MSIKYVLVIFEIGQKAAFLECGWALDAKILMVTKLSGFHSPPASPSLIINGGPMNPLQTATVKLTRNAY